jgi:hypothetical protein
MQTQEQLSFPQQDMHQNALRINIGWAILSAMLMLAIFSRWSFEWEYWLSGFLLALFGPILDVRWSAHASLPKEVEKVKKRFLGWSCPAGEGNADTPGQIPELHGHLHEKLQTSDHRFLVNEVGILLYTATSQDEAETLEHKKATELQFAEILTLADFVKQRHEQFRHRQEQLEQMWRTVADELIGCFGAQASGSAVQVTGKQIQQLLETLGPVPFHRDQPATRPAGHWYQSLWTPNGYPFTFRQQWVPFLRVFRQRCQERFPEKYTSDGLLREPQGV